MARTCSKSLPLDQVVVTTASRSAGAVYKHSFHINFPRVGFINNYGALRTLARHLNSLDALQTMSANFQPMSLIDTSVYSQNQNLRIIESWKHHPRPAKKMAPSTSYKTCDTEGIHFTTDTQDTTLVDLERVEYAYLARCLSARMA